MSTLLPIALITYKEGIRNKAFFGVSLVALLLLCAGALISIMVPQEMGKAAVDMALSVISFSGLLVVFFVGINLMAKDLDRRTIYMVLSRPISRSQYIIGKFIGMLFLIVMTMLFVSLLAIILLFLLKMGYPDRFERFSWSLVLLAAFLSTLGLVLLSSLSILFASFTSASFVTSALTVVVYIIGQSLGDMKTLVETPQSFPVGISPFIVKLVQTVYYIFPNLSLFDIKMQAAHNLSPSFSYIVWTALYGLFYTCVAITLAALIFKKKEVP